MSRSFDQGENTPYYQPPKHHHKNPPKTEHVTKAIIIKISHHRFNLCLYVLIRMGLD